MMHSRKTIVTGGSVTGRTFWSDVLKGHVMPSEAKAFARRHYGTGVTSMRHESTDPEGQRRIVSHWKADGAGKLHQLLGTDGGAHLKWVGP